MKNERQSPETGFPTRVNSYEFSWSGELFRVVVAGDVVALPSEHWSGSGYGQEISEDWLLHSGELPKRGPTRRRILAYMIRRGLAEHYGYLLGDLAWPFPQWEAPRVSR